MTFQIQEYFRDQIEKSKKLEKMWIDTRKRELSKFPDRYIEIMDELIQAEKKRRGLK